jgi:hypothetical protein
MQRGPILVRHLMKCLNLKMKPVSYTVPTVRKNHCIVIQLLISTPGLATRSDWLFRRSGPRSRGRPRKFTVKTRQQSGRQILVSKILFTRFTDSVIFLDFCRNYYAWLGRFWGLDKSIFGEERGIFEILTWY